MDPHDLDALMARHRPDRYRAGDLSWTAAVEQVVGDSFTWKQARQIAAEAQIKAREAQATRKANRLLRELSNTGVMPLDWLDLARWPVAVGAERICFEAMTAADFRQFATDERDAANRDHAARLDTCKGAEMLADQLDAAGPKTTVAQLLAPKAAA